MSDLISRCELFNRLAPVQTLGEAYGIIQGMEPVDAVPVVRCKDCKRWDKYHNEQIGECKWTFRVTKAEGYCDDAERKDGDDD